ncbi:AAA family ATPase [Methylobacter sp. Wu1]|jgi:predicted ATP-binding protein involved in virulence|uniref:AAA family ATPase n=1 Tax=Methylobacter sp. Wu1 TaxID=3119359 RepID=UPI002F92E9CE
MKKNSSIKALENKARKGDLEALFQLGEHYSQGKFVEVDTILSNQYFDQFVEAFREPRLTMSSLKLVNFRGFESAEIKLSASKVTVFIGNNGAGKTTLLDAIVKTLSWLRIFLVSHDGKGKSIDSSDINNIAVENYASIISNFTLLNSDYIVELSKARDGSNTKRSGQIQNFRLLASFYKLARSRNSQFNFPILAYYSVDRTVELRSQQLVQASEIASSRKSAQLFAYNNSLNGIADFKTFFQWFKDLDDIVNSESQLNQDVLIAIAKLEAELDSDLFSQMEQQAKLDENTRKVLADFKNTKQKEIDELKSRFNKIEPILAKQIIDNVSNAIYQFLPEFSNLRIQRLPSIDLLITKNEITLSISQLSDGEKTLLALIADIARLLVTLNPSLSNPLLGNGIILIDEIELHLHPNWQRAVIGKLNKTFPNCQFILTTHSPIVISESRDLLCYSLENGEVQKLENLYGMDVNQVLLQEMDADIRNAEIQTDLDDLRDCLQDGKLEEAKKLIAELEQKIAIDHIELNKARLLIRRLEVQRAANP